MLFGGGCTVSHVHLAKLFTTEFQRAPRTANETQDKQGEIRSHAFGAAMLGEKRTERTSRWKKKRFPHIFIPNPVWHCLFENLAGSRKEGSLQPIITTVEQTVKVVIPMPAHCQLAWLSSLPRNKGRESNALRGSNGRRLFTAAAPRNYSQRI